ncbi:hypothetical protein [Methanopyrus sp.]
MPVRESLLIDTDVRYSLVIGSVLEKCEVERAAVLGTVARNERFERGVFVAGKRVPGEVITVEVEVSREVVRSGSVEIDLDPADPDLVAVVADVRAAGLIAEITGLRPELRGFHALFAFSGELPARTRKRMVNNLDVFRECCPCALLEVGNVELRFLGGGQVFDERSRLSYTDVLAVRDGEPIASAWRPASRSVISELGGQVRDRGGNR